MTAGTTISATGPAIAGTPGTGSEAGHQPRPATLDADRQYVTIGVDKEIFAFDVQQVCEVLDVQPFTRLPNMPAVLRGMIDHGKRSVPVFDMRVKFGLPPTEPTPKTRIVVLEVPFTDRSLIVGALTDRVYEVTALDSGDVEDPPDVCASANAEAILGLGRRQGQIVIILDATKVFDTTDLSHAMRRGGTGNGEANSGSGSDGHTDGNA